MSEFASKWPHMRDWALERARTATGVKVSAERDDELAQQVVISVTPAQLETAVSRFYLVTAECWDYSKPLEQKSKGFDLATDVGYAIESSPRDSNPVVKADLNAGPNEDRDEAGHYFYTVTVLVTAHRLP